MRREKTILISFFLLTILCASRGFGAEMKYYKIGKLETPWAAPIEPAAWAGFSPVAITKFIRGFPKKHPQYQASFRLGWHERGLILQVQTLDTQPRPPVSTNPQSIKNAFKYDSVEFWVNQSQFVVYMLDGKPTVNGYPIRQWRKKKMQTKLKSIWLHSEIKNHLRTYEVFLPWTIFQRGKDAGKAPEGKPFAVAVGVNDKDASGYAQIYSPTIYVFQEPSLYASCILSRSQKGTAEQWEESAGRLPTCKIAYDAAGYVALKLKCGKKYYQELKSVTAKVTLYPIANPKQKREISIDKVRLGTTRLQEAFLIPALERKITEAKGFVKLDDLKIPIIMQQRVIPYPGGINAYTMKNPPPADLREFWDKAVKEAHRVPLKPQISKIETKKNGATVYKVILNGADGIPSVGFLTIPKDKSKKYPCLIRGNGYGGYNGAYDLSAKGIVTFSHNTRGQGYSKELHDYKKYLITLNAPDRDKYYYRQAYMDYLRVIDFMAQQPNVDASRIGLTGGSQGASLALVGAALDKRIKFIAVIDPGFCGWDISCDMYESGHYSNFIKLTKKKGGPSRKKVLKFLEYFDVAYLSAWITCPTLFVNDLISFPEGTAAAFNNIASKDKYLITYPDGNHCFVDDRYRKKFAEYLDKYLGAVKK